MERIVDFIMTSLFQMAEYILDKCTFLIKEPAPVVPQKVVHTIHFSDEDKPTRSKIEMVEGDLFE